MARSILPSPEARAVAGRRSVRTARLERGSMCSSWISKGVVMLCKGGYTWCLELCELLCEVCRFPR